MVVLSIGSAVSYRGLSPVSSPPAISIEGMPIAVSRTGLSGEGLGRVKTRPLVGPPRTAFLEVANDAVGI